ncbi:MAG TPA: hypothetical protein PKD90_08070, partial [Phnomibacter sp.]|nr:hypothetical protein [Phnomibacter sp.]
MLSLLRKIRHRFRLYAEKLNPLQFNVDQAQQSDLLIIDNIYPHPLSDWRYIEFNEYLKAFNQVHIYTGVIEGNRIVVPAQYAEHKQWLQQNHGTLLQGNHKVEALSEQANINAKLAYCLFYHNLSYVFPLLERYQIPFVFTLYPGGRFALYDHTVRENLRRYTSSPLFRHLFVNMPNIYQYAREQLGVPASKLTLCYGGPIFTNNLAFSSYPLSRYTIQPLRICFAAHQYMPMALNKGYDVFCKLAQAFEKYPDIQFTVIGGLHSGDSFFAPLPNIAYAGELEAEALDECFSRMH